MLLSRLNLDSMIEKCSNLLLCSYCNVKNSIVILWVNFYWIQAHNRFFLGYIITDQRFLKVVTVYSQADQKYNPSNQTRNFTKQMTFCLFWAQFKYSYLNQNILWIILRHNLNFEQKSRKIQIFMGVLNIIVQNAENCLGIILWHIN